MAVPVGAVMGAGGQPGGSTLGWDPQWLPFLGVTSDATWSGPMESPPCGDWGLGDACLYCGLELALAQGIAFACFEPTKRDKDGSKGWSGVLFRKRTPKETGSL